MLEIVGFLVAGAFGSLAKDIVSDGSLRLPHIKDGQLVLGFIGGMVVGAFVGYVVDNSLLMAVLSGYVGTSAIQHLLPSNSVK